MMRPLSTFLPSDAEHLEGLLFDLDDTVLTHGCLTRAAYDALWSLHDAGWRLVVVTGRPSSWGHTIAIQWPVDAVVTENGAISFVRDGGRVSRVDRCLPAERARRREALTAIAATAASRAPDVKLTEDAAGRISDVTWDIGEYEHPARERIEIVRRIIAEHGARSSTSSVHLHATFDTDDKATGAVRLLGTTFGVDATRARIRWAFVGDSGNDRACFAAFSTTFGVANVTAALSSIAVAPRWIASAPMGAGFAEVARTLVGCKMRK